MIRLNVVVEGQTEEGYVNQVLVTHLGASGVVTSARAVLTSRTRTRTYRGGLIDYVRARRDLEQWMKQDQSTEAWFTTMFDLYRLPPEFPDFALAQRRSDPYERVRILEEGLSRDLMHPRFVPYIQLHEFEALLLADPQQLDWGYPEHAAPIRRLIEVAGSFDCPELIDDGEETAPSRRIIREIPEYASEKATVGPLVAEKIGIEVLRRRCPHFGERLGKLESLGERTSTDQGAGHTPETG